MGVVLTIQLSAAHVDPELTMQVETLRMKNTMLT